MVRRFGNAIERRSTEKKEQPRSEEPQKEQQAQRQGGMQVLSYIFSNIKIVYSNNSPLLGRNCFNLLEMLMRWVY